MDNINYNSGSTNGLGTVDLVNVPLGITILEGIAAGFSDAVIQAQFDTQLSALQEKISTAIGDTGMGFLIEVKYYEDYLGRKSIPGGQLIYPVGVGTEMVDAMAEHLRPGLLRPSFARRTPPSSFKNMTYHIWIKKTEGGNLQGSVQPAMFRDRFMKDSNAEAERRNQMVLFERSFPGDTIKYIQRAEFWQEVISSYRSQLSSDVKRAKIDDLNRRMNLLQQDFNKVYARYQKTEQEIARKQSYLSALETVSNITSIIDSGIRTGSLLSTQVGTPVKGVGESDTSLEGSTDWAMGQIDLLEKAQEADIAEMEAKAPKLRDTDIQIRKEFQGDRIPIPASPELIVPVPVPGRT